MPKRPTAATQMRVVKIGGSLLWEELLETRLRKWFDAQQPHHTLLVVGGGALADAVRKLDRRYGLSAEAAHEQAIRAMQVNAFALSKLSCDVTWITGLDNWSKLLRAHKTGEPVQRAALDPVPFLMSDEPQRAGTRLPCGWQVTSDSIAARLAEVVGAVELVLLKSTLPPGSAECAPIRDAAAASFVDQHFSIAAKRLTNVRAVNLRDPAFPEVQLTV